MVLSVRILGVDCGTPKYLELPFTLLTEMRHYLLYSMYVVSTCIFGSHIPKRYLK